MHQLAFASVCVALLLGATRAAAQCEQIGAVCAGPFPNCTQTLCEFQSVAVNDSAVFVETVQSPFSPIYPTGLDVSYNNEYMSSYNALSQAIEVFRNNGGTFELVSNHSVAHAVNITFISNGGNSVITSQRNAVSGSDALVIYERAGASLSTIQTITVTDHPDEGAMTAFDVSADGTRMVWYNNDGASGIDLRVFERGSDTGTFSEVATKKVSNADNQRLSTNGLRHATCNNDCTITSLAYDDNSAASGYNLFVVERDSGSWTRTALPQPAVAGEEGPPYELYSVSMNVPGDAIAFGNPLFTIGGTLTGRAFFYRRIGGTWTAIPGEFRNPSPGPGFAWDLVITPDDTTSIYVLDTANSRALFASSGLFQLFTGLQDERMAISNGGQSVFFPSAANSGADWYAKNATFTCSGHDFAPSTYQCHTAAGQCDRNTTCSGTSNGCPNFYKSRGTSCTVSANATNPFDDGCYAVQCSGSSADCTVSTASKNGATCDASSKKRALPQGTCKLSDLCDAGLCIENAGILAFQGCNVAGAIHATFPCVSGKRCVAMLAEG